ncbi:hypothetical protein BCL90_3093 [Pedobacter alluvionis]|uniref:Uncharacterized protein n=1 Tax=Pedobacter alluvionis TaxID=475253 RepID=A0A497XXC4_9SPHI|nr:hypothetical protein BCL90_3093 [Pedobacter alluvionis]
MNYKISFSEMDQLGRKVNLKKINVSLAQMRLQALNLKAKSISEVKKRSI